MTGVRSGVIAISGIGMLSPLGVGAKTVMDAFRAGVKPAPVPVPELAGSVLADALAYRVPEFEAAAVLGGRRMLKFMSAAAVLGCGAAREAAADADMRNRFPPERMGVFAATGLSAADLGDIRPAVERSLDAAGNFSCRRLGEMGLAAANPLLSFKILSNIPPCLVSIQENAQGPNLIFNPWEGQGGAAIAEACAAIASGEVDGALTGGADFPSQPSTYIYLRQAGLLQPGEYPSAGAAYLFLERLETALRDRRHVHAVIRTVGLRFADAAPFDPLAPVIGRTFAAAPALALATAAQGGWREVKVCGVDRQTFAATLEAAPS